MNKFPLIVAMLVAVATGANAVCDGIADGTFVVDPFGDCQSYIVCFGNIEHPRRCPDGFYFDEPGQMCNYWDLVPCGDPAGPCYGKPQYAFVPRPPPAGTCSSYYRCDYQEGIPFDCPDGLHFDAAAGTCDYPSTCTDPTPPTPSTQPTTTVVPTTTTTTQTTTIPTASTPAPTAAP